MFNIYGKYFFGNEISEYGQENNRLDYETLAKSFDCILCNDFMEKTGFENWEQIAGFEDEEEEYYSDVFQWFITDQRGAEILRECDEVVYYNYDLNLYLWGVTHWGTAWSHVLTDIPCNTGKF